MHSPVSSERSPHTSVRNTEAPDDMEMEEAGAGSGVSPYKEFDKLSRKVMALLPTIAIKCDNELSKTMRTDDPKRESIMAVVSEQSALVKEVVRITLREMWDKCCSKSNDEVIELLESAGICDAGRLKNHLTKCEEMKSALDKLSQKLECPLSQISRKVDEALMTTASLSKKNSEMKEELNRERLQVEELRQRMEKWRNQVVNPRDDQDDIGNDSNRHMIQRGVRSDCLLQDSQATSMQSTQRSLRHTQNVESRSELRIPGSSDTGEECISDFSMSDYIRTMSLPEVQPFGGKPHECFKRFLCSFEMKYPKNKWTDASRIQLLNSFLRKNALTVFETLPAEIREGSFDGVIEAMKRRMAIHGNSEKIKALSDLRKLTLREDQSVAEFCWVLERIASKAYPDAPPEVTALQKAEILSRQLASWSGSYCLTEALETSTSAEVYEKVKETALRLERSAKIAEECRKTGRSKLVQQLKPRWDKRSAELRTPLVMEENHQENNVESTGISRTKNKNAQFGKNGARKESRPCFACGKPGHVARDCRTPQSQAKAVTAVAGTEKPPGSYAALVEKWVCTTEAKTGDKEFDEFFGKKTVVDIVIFGIKAQALLDTGSQVTVIPVKLLKKAIDSGINLDHHVERLPPPRVRIRDASENLMAFLDTIRVCVQFEEVEKFIPAFVGKGVGEMVILGTNALKRFDIKLVQGLNGRSSQQPHSMEADGRKSEVRAEIVQRTFIPPGATKLVSLTCAHEGSLDTAVFSSRHPLIMDGLCSTIDKETVIPVTNNTTEALVLQKGEVVGEWRNEEWVKPKHFELDRDMLDVGETKKWTSYEERLERLLEIIKQRSQLTDKAIELMSKFNDAFAVTDAELTQTDLVVHDIDTADHKPIKQKTRPVPFAARKNFKSLIKDLLNRGIIEQSSSEWASPVVLVKKKDGSLRICIDYRELNKITRQDSYPLPKIDTVLQCLGGKKVFSTMDLASGYWQIRLSEEAKQKSAFTTSEGLYQFTVLPFGLCTSPAVFQRMMDMVLKELRMDDEVFVYIDDILVATETVERHYLVLEKVLGALRKANLRLKPQKCEFFQDKVAFLGHLIDKDGIKADPDKVKKIAQYPAPRKVAELRTFLGMASYYRKFIAGFSKLARSLYALTSPKTKWKWTNEETTSFEALKRAMISAPVLAQPNVAAAENGTRPFIIYTDASKEGVGAVLCQMGDDQLLHPIFFASKTPTKAEKNYHITDLEALAVVFALRKFHFFVYGLDVVIRTDHQPLTCLFKRTNISARVLRWALEIQNYKIKIEYVAGKANAVAD
ncbi:hypothetical protein V3C99_003171, partial [Haemonchus contortus]